MCIHLGLIAMELGDANHSEERIFVILFIDKLDTCIPVIEICVGDEIYPSMFISDMFLPYHVARNSA